MKISAGIIALAVKIGTKILPVLLKSIKALKVGKAGLAAGAVASYVYLFTWQFAIMLVILLFVHESGHIWAMKRCGMKTKGIYLLPFFGAVAVADEMFKSRRDEAYIAIMGPIWGFGISLVTAGLYFVTDNAMFAAAAGWMAMINLFNLLPISPLDGGRIVKSVTFSVHSKIGMSFLIIGMIISIILTFWAGLILFFILLIIGSLEFYFEYRLRDPDQIIRRSIKDIDSITSDGPLHEIKLAAVKIRNILTDEKTDSSYKIDTILSYQNHDDFGLRALSQLVSIRLKDYTPMPKMTTTGIIGTIMVYAIVVAVLWGLMAYMSHIPEVEIARQLFMS